MGRWNNFARLLLRHGLAHVQSIAALCVVAAVTGCATIPPGAGEHPSDPLEVYNRHVFDFNDRADRYVLRPVAETYVKVVPYGVRVCVSNAFGNLGDVTNAVNNLLQGRPTGAVSDLCRVAINTTIGLLGCFDVASKMGLAKSNEDFGQTLGYWGVESGPYFVLPILGPSTIRDTFGRAVDIYTDPLSHVQSEAWQYGGQSMRVIDVRASLLQASDVLAGAALDRYQFVRDAYLQRRRSLISNGDPNGEALPQYEDDPGDEPKQETQPENEGDKQAPSKPEQPAAEPAKQGDGDQPPAEPKR
jgi:phospholipid-binding lipoprotein MlaA